MNPNFYTTTETGTDKDLVDKAMQDFPEEAIIPVNCEPPYINVKRPSQYNRPHPYLRGDILFEVLPGKEVKLNESNGVDITTSAHRAAKFTFRDRRFSIIGNVTLAEGVVLEEIAENG